MASSQSADQGAYGSTNDALGDSSESVDETETLWSCSGCSYFNKPSNNVCKNCQFNRLNALTPVVDTPPWLTMPPTWLTPVPGTKCLKTKLFERDPEYVTVKEHINQTDRYYGSLRQIVQIYRLENPTQFSTYQLRKIQMDMDNGPDVQNERMLFHGTTMKAANLISINGFNRSYAGKNATLFGRGVNFSRDFGYSANSRFSPADHRGIKCIFRCRVLTGYFTAGGASPGGELVEPPFRDKSRYVRFDSTVNRTKYPGIFVVYHDAAAYPEYFMTFRSTGGLYA